jgi:hypothetical protein
MKEIQEEKEDTTLQSNGVQEADIAIASADMVGKSVSHTLFGQGTITNVTDDGYIIVNFQKHGYKALSYQVHIEKGLISTV